MARHRPGSPRSGGGRRFRDKRFERLDSQIALRRLSGHRLDGHGFGTKEKTSDSADAVLHVEHVAKSFRLPTEQVSGLKQAFVNRAKGVKGYKEQHVLRDISFDVKRGDFFGIVG